jgi:Ca2+-binding RTX toxin-like protein
MNLESLEARRLFSVTVYEGYPGFYEIHGDDADNYIEASLNMAEATMTVGGQTYSGVQYVVAYGYGGNDSLIITSADGAGLIAASIVAGDGSDIIMLGIDGAVWAGAGNDELYLMDSFRGQAYGESGNDYMNISGATVDADIEGGSGADFIDCSGNASRVVVRGGSGDDTIIGSEFGDELHGDEGNDSLDGGGGDDMFYSYGGGLDIINGGNGYDIAYVDDRDAVDVEQFYVI